MEAYGEEALYKADGCTPQRAYARDVHAGHYAFASDPRPPSSPPSEVPRTTDTFASFDSPWEEVVVPPPPRMAPVAIVSSTPHRDSAEAAPRDNTPAPQAPEPPLGPTPVVVRATADHE